MRSWIDTKGLKFKLWTYFGLFAVAIMIVLWLLQIIFLQTYYESMKIHEIEKIGQTIVARYGEKDFENIVYEKSYYNGIVVQMLDNTGKPIFTSNMFGDFRPSKANPEEFKVFISKITESKSGEVSYTLNDAAARQNIAVYGAKIADENGNTVYLYMNSPLAPVDATTQVLQTQLIAVTILSLLFAFILSYFIARRMANPIVKITKSAMVLAGGDYDVEFEQGGYTEINQLANALNFTTKELSKTDELRRDLIANVSHDLRTPLTIVKSYAEMIRDISGNNPEKRNAHTKVIIEESDRLSQLVTDILDLSKMEAETAGLNLMKFDLTATVKNILTRFHVLVEKDNYFFKLDCPDGVMVLGDRPKIEQVLYNLIGNAVNYTGDDKTVSIRIADGGERVRLSVTDTGRGIEPEELPRVWERYYRTSKTHKRTVVGTGIGLSIVKRILDLHKTRFGVDSTVGQGSTFWFELDKEV